MKQKKRMMDIVHSKFVEENWYYVYEYLANHHVDDVKGKELLPTNATYDELMWYEIIAEDRFPVTEGKMLEIGSHWGRFCFYKNNTTDMEIVGIDASQTKIEHVAQYNIKNIKFIKMLAENLPFNNEFDVIYMFETLEHVGDLDRSFQNIRKAVKPGGCMIFSIPIMDNWDGGFHTQKHSKEFWKTKFKEHFDTGEILTVRDGQMLIGKLIKGEKL